MAKRITGISNGIWHQHHQLQCIMVSSKENDIEKAAQQLNGYLALIMA
jgi:hypothetical protein